MGTRAETISTRKKGVKMGLKTVPPGRQESSLGDGHLAQEIRWVLLGPCRCRRVPLRYVEEFGRAYVETPKHGARYGL